MRIPVLALSVVCAASVLEAQERPVALVGANVVDVVNQRVLPDHDVILHHGRIAEVYRTGTRGRLAPSSTVNLRGKYIIPGLIDAHVHVATDPAGRDANATDQLARAFRGGITSVRDMAGDAMALRDLAVRSAQPGSAMPRLYYGALFAGPSFFTDPRTKSAARGGRPGEVAWLRAVDSSTELARAVREAKALGVTGVKVYADLGPAEIQRLAAEAHRQGLKVWSHATVYPARPSDAVNAGVDVLSHAILMFWEGASEVPHQYHQRAATALYESLPVNGPTIDSLLATMKRRGTVLDATLFISARLESAPRGAAGMQDPKRAVQWMYDLTARANELGIPVAAGTDGMLPGGETELPNLHRELELLVQRARFTPLQALRAATLYSARAIGVDSTLGSVTPGKHADLVILGADPTSDIRNTRKIEAVIREGVIHRLPRNVASRGM